MPRTAPAPFLEHVYLADPAEEADADGSDEAEATNADDPYAHLGPEDFPAWYRDKVDGGDDVDAVGDAAGGSEDGAGDEGIDREAEPGSGGAADTPYWASLPVVQHLEALTFGPVTVFAGDNGSGKSTVVEAIAVAAGFNPEGGSRNLMFETHSTHSALHERMILRWRKRPRWGWFLRAETFYGMASHIAEDDDPEYGLAAIFPDLHGGSHGESFLALAESRFTGAGLYLLDEPESALSIQGQMRLAAIIARSVAAGSQFVISTHSPFLMATPGARIWELDAAAPPTERAFDDLTSTALWRRFFTDPPTFHSHLTPRA